MRVLIIDDNRAHGESLSELLNSHGFEAYFAPDLAEADWLCGLFRFQLAILDHDMPGLNGPEVAEKLTSRNPQLRSVVMSASESNRRFCEEKGHFPFLPKPFSLEQLLALVSHLGLVEGGASLVRRLAFPLQKYTRKNAP